MMNERLERASVMVIVVIATVILGWLGTMVSAGNEKEGLAAITSLRNEYAAAWKAGDADHVARLYTSDGVVLYPNKPAVFGRANILVYFKGFFDEYVQNKFELTSEEVTIAGTWAFDRGSYAISMTPRKGGGPIEDNGKYLVILQREGDGSWKVARDMDNSNNPQR